MRRISTMPPHRDPYEIIKQILQIVYSREDGICKLFELAYRCQLTWQQFKYYRDLLIGRKLLMISSNTGPIQHYEITDKGLRYLKLFAEIQDYLRSCRYT
ncbi:MAG: winged helix-turn-helix domain-containing protein [Nitrososphaeraceae archaeon]